MKIAHRWSKLLLVASIALPMAAQQQPHVGGMNDEQFPPPERLGTVHFETSCAPAVTAKFDRAVALLHSFWFPAAIAEFNDVLKEDPSCGIAYWGISLSTFGNPFGGGRSPKQLQDGLTFSQKAEAVGAKTERERDYIAAVGELYKDSGTLDEQARKLKYEAAMEQLAVKYTERLRSSNFLRSRYRSDGGPHGQNLCQATPGRGDSGGAAQDASGSSGNRALYHPLLRHTGAGSARTARGTVVCEYRAVRAPRAAHAVAHLHARRRLGRLDRGERQVGGNLTKSRFPGR